ncbi:MAG TPA: transcriptional regulator GcvA [Alphaproteobacteria bacterium]|nr:transcriptional regulator GcvA [Alphaproteobacteria bacterium]
MKRLPSLEALRAFEAAARHLNFTKAGDELHVTQSALSHRISALEGELGVQLFQRLARRMELTPEGAIVAEGVRRGLDEIRRGLARLDSGPATLTVSVLPSFATRWLVPRLPAFARRHPGVEVRIAAEPAMVDLRSGVADIAIRFGRGNYPGLYVLKILDDAVVAVASPSFLAEHGPFAAPADMARVALLHDSPTETDGSGADWRSWLMHIGAGDVRSDAGTRFNQAVLALEAAANGLGIALARLSLCSGDLASGRLVQVLPHSAPTTFAYFFVCLPEHADRLAISAFRDWLIDEARVRGPSTVVA